jgi:PAS domain S-box-containing protein
MSAVDAQASEAFQASGAYTWDWNLQTGELFLSAPWSALTGYAEADRPRTYERWARLIVPADRPTQQGALLRHMTGEQARYVCEYRLTGADGGLIWCCDRGAIVARDAAGKPLRMAGIGFNIAFPEKIGGDLGQRNRLLQTIIDLIPDNIYAKDINRRKILANRADRFYMGVVDEVDALGKLDEEVYGAAEAEHFRRQDETALAGQPVINVEEQIFIGNESRWLLTTKVPLFDAQGIVVGLVGIGRDITELHRTRAESEQLNRTLEARVAERTASLVEAQRIAHLGSWAYELDSAYIQLSDECRRILGISPAPAPFVLAELMAMIHPDDHPLAFEAIADATEHENPEPREFRFVRSDGCTIYLATRSQKVHQDGVLTRIVGTVQDITERKLAELEQRRLTAIIEATTDLIGTTDRNGNSVYLNRGGRRLLGIDPDADISHLNAADLYPPAAFARLRAEAIPTAIAQGVWTGENLVRHLDGREIPVSQVILCHPDHEGSVAYLSTIARDVTPHKQAAEALRRSHDELQAANKALEKAARLKDEFLANMSHELRTPLTGILGMAEALQGQTYGTLNERQLRSLHLIETSGRHLLDLINDILDLSKIEAGQFEIHRAPRQLAEICQASLQMIAGVVQQKGQRVQFAIEPQRIEIVVDARRLKQMLTNLLGNAAKFTPEGGELGLLVQGDSDAGHVRLSVWDTGMGIAPEDVARLFQPFTQLDSSLTRQHAGTGLGLVLVRRMAELHGGTVQVESTPGAGSRFTITLPWSPGRPADGGDMSTVMTNLS